MFLSAQSTSSVNTWLRGSDKELKKLRDWKQTAWVQIPFLPFTSWETLNKTLHLSGP